MADLIAVKVIEQASSSGWSDFLAQAVAAFIGASFAFGFALWLTRRQRVAASTAEMIGQFSSREMITSRYVTADIAARVEREEIDIKEIAKSSLQDCPKGFVGETIDGLTEHQHMSNLIGWLRRLAVQLRYKWVSRNTIALTLGGSLQWSLPFLLRVAAATEELAREYTSERPLSARAAWVYALRYVDSELKRAKYSALAERRLRSWRWKKRT